MRYIAILIALVVVLALALIGLPTSGSDIIGPTGTTSATTPVGSTAAAQSDGGYGSAIQAARNAVNVASQAAQNAANANP